MHKSWAAAGLTPRMLEEARRLPGGWWMVVQVRARLAAALSLNIKSSGGDCRWPARARREMMEWVVVGCVCVCARERGALGLASGRPRMHPCQHSCFSVNALPDTPHGCTCVGCSTLVLVDGQHVRCAWHPTHGVLLVTQERLSNSWRMYHNLGPSEKRSALPAVEAAVRKAHTVGVGAGDGAAAAVAAHGDLR